MFSLMWKFASGHETKGGYSLTAGDEEASIQEKPSGTRSSTAQFWKVCNIGLFICSLVLFWMSASHRNGNYSTERNSLLKATNSYSPLLDAIDIPLLDVQVNGTLLNMHNSIYRQPPSPEVDAAWRRLGNVDALVISTKEVIALGKDPRSSARYPESFGLGPDAHIAEPNAMHHFHCLDVLRKDIDFNYYFGDKYPGGVKPERHRVHTSHCLYILLQHLMCTASTDIIVLDWVEGQQAPFPDFNINRKCRDFEAILEYQKITGIDGNVVARLKASEGQQRVPMSDEFLELFEVSDEHRIPHNDHDNDLD